MDEARKKAFDFAADATKQILTLATGILALTITFTKDILGGSPHFSALLGWAWVLYLVSICFGLWTLLALTGSLEPEPAAQAAAAPQAGGAPHGGAAPQAGGAPQPGGAPQAGTVPSIRGKNVKIPSLLQLGTFALATLLIVVFAINAPRGTSSSQSGPHTVSAPAQSGQPGASKK